MVSCCNKTYIKLTSGQKIYMRTLPSLILLYYISCQLFLGHTGINVSASLESLGEEIKITAEKNRCLQDLERSDHSVKSNVSMQSSQNENDLVNSSCSSSLLERIAKAKSLLPKSQEVLKAVDQNNATKKVYTPNSVPSKAKSIFTPVLPDFKFKTPNSTHGSGSMPRSGGHCSEAQNGRKLFSSNGQISIPSYQRQTASSTLKKSPTKVSSYEKAYPRPELNYR